MNEPVYVRYVCKICYDLTELEEALGRGMEWGLPWSLVPEHTEKTGHDDWIQVICRGP